MVIKAVASDLNQAVIINLHGDPGVVAVGAGVDGDVRRDRFKRRTAGTDKYLPGRLAIKRRML